MLHTLAFVLAAVAVVSLADIAAEQLRLPAAVLLTVIGLAYAGLPGRNVTLDPHIVLTFVIPPLLYSAALNSSLLAIRRNLRPVISLSVFLVLVTALLVGIGMDLFVPGITLAAGVALGAAVAPPDPVAALAVGRRAGLPPRVTTLIEGEGLLNDATALSVFTVAVEVTVTGGFSVPGAFGRFVLAAAGGVVVGIVTAYLVRTARALIDEPIVLNVLSLATPFAAYLLGEELHVSGVLAVVITGLMVGHDTPRAVSGASRLQTAAVWRLVDFLLEGFVFLLIGQQLPEVLRGLKEYPASTVVIAASVTLGVVLLVRPLWLGLMQLLPRARLGARDRQHREGLSTSEMLVLSWAGTRGVISLAAIFSLPLTTNSGAPFPERHLLLFCTFLVVLVTLVGQGLTIAPLAKALGLRADFADQARVRNEARAASVAAALDRIDELADNDLLEPRLVEQLRENLRRRSKQYARRLEALEAAEGGEIPVSPARDAALNLRRAVIEAQREEILRWRDAGRLPDASLRILLRELDHEESGVPRI